MVAAGDAAMVIRVGLRHVFHPMAGAPSASSVTPSSAEASLVALGILLLLLVPPAPASEDDSENLRRTSTTGEKTAAVGIAEAVCAEALNAGPLGLRPLPSRREEAPAPAAVADPASRPQTGAREGEQEEKQAGLRSHAGVVEGDVKQLAACSEAAVARKMSADTAGEGKEAGIAAHPHGER